MDSKTFQETVAQFDLTQAEYAEKFYWRLAEPGMLQMTHYMLNLGTETGELQDVLKKFLRDGKSCDVLNIKEELGDLLWTIARISTLLGTSLEDIMKMNVAKLETRYPAGWAENPPRDPKKEQLAMLKAVETEETRELARRLKEELLALPTTDGTNENSSQ